MGTGGGHAPPEFRGIVRWESAAPIQEAGKGKLADDFANHDVICLIGLPLGRRRSDPRHGDQPKVGKGTLERIQAASSLTTKGEDAAQSGVAQVIGDALRRGFSKETMKLSPRR